MTVTDYIPHGLVLALGSVVTYVFRDHVKQDDARYKEIRDGLGEMTAGQTALAKNIADNHAEVLRLLLSASQHAATNAAIAEARRETIEK